MRDTFALFVLTKLYCFLLKSSGHTKAKKHPLTQLFKVSYAEFVFAFFVCVVWHCLFSQNVMTYRKIITKINYKKPAAKLD